MSDSDEPSPSDRAIEPLDGAKNPFEPEGSRASQVIRDFFSTVWKITRYPFQFFGSLPKRGSLTSALVIALVAHWLGAAGSYLLGGLIELLTGENGFFGKGIWNKFDAEFLEDVHSQGRRAQWEEMGRYVDQWMVGAGSVIVDPFYTLISILLTSLVVFITARIFISPRQSSFEDYPEISYENIARIVSYAHAPSLFKFVPYVGSTLVQLYILLLGVIGIQTFFKISTARAFVVAFFPMILVMIGIMGTIIFVFLLLAGALLTLGSM